jgi:hypothetical protein
MDEASQDAKFPAHNTYHDEQEQSSHRRMEGPLLGCNMCHMDLLTLRC